MNKKTIVTTEKPLPLRRKLSGDVLLSLIIALLMTMISVAGLIFPDILYPTEDLHRGFHTTDILNLVMGLPLLIGALILTSRGKLIGLLFWPGALFFINYHYIAYAVAQPMTLQFIVYIVLVFLSAWAIIRLLNRIDCNEVKERLANNVAIRFTAVVLIVLGALFFSRAVAIIFNTLSEGKMLPATDFADLIISPIWIIGGFLLWKKKAMGYVVGASLIFQATNLFIGLLIYFIIQPIVSSVPFPVIDFVVIFVMGCIVFVPFGFFVSGIIKS